ncbi:MAG TPA: FAD-binding protein [Burkholderiales bacterium]|nr:FAD-binding protein [Burkholderiales bacterium]
MNLARALAASKIGGLKPTHPLSCDVLIIGSGAAGMYAALAAARAGARVLLVDRSLIGRGGATVMAQMTVAVALGEEVPDHWEDHFADTLKAGRGLCEEPLARLLCEQAPACIRELDAWGVGWARKNGHISQVQAPGHDRPRCVYVDFVNTGPAVSKTLRAQLQRTSEVQRTGDLLVTELAMHDGVCVGAHAVHVASGRSVPIAAKATLIATGGLTRLYARNSASLNMGGDGYALALAAGAELIDMEFVQFFPIGHLAPRLVGMDPIMWDPFRYKLGGRLLNAERREFLREAGRYSAARDVATYAILTEVAEGRGSPHGGVWLSFEHCSEAELRAAFGPIIDRLAANGIDLTRAPIEVAPIAHYHMGGIRVDADMRTAVPHLFAAGEAVGAANGANRLSGNAITEALVFGRRAGERAAALAASTAMPTLKPAARSAAAKREINPAAEIVRLQAVMNDHVGPLRTRAGLEQALEHIAQLAEPCATLGAPRGAFDAEWLDLHDLASMRLVAECITRAALARTESRGAHQRADFPETSARWQRHQHLRHGERGLRIES